MTIVAFNDLMAQAEHGKYAVGYFECWNLESLLAVADAAEATRSPVLLGFSGLTLPHPARTRRDPLNVYASMGLEVCRAISVPAGLVFNECPDFYRVLEAVALGYSLVMFSDESLSLEEQAARVQQVVETAHQAGTAVEGEALSLPGLSGELVEIPEQIPLSEVQTARDFISQTGVDAFAVNLGQLHLHGRQEVRLNLDLLQELRHALEVPLVLHGSSSVNCQDLVEAIQLGIRKINVGSALKQAYFESMQTACSSIGDGYNPYEVIGSGQSNDVLMAGRVALQRAVEELMRLFGSAGKGNPAP
jgi:fructose/tagatose bisphosphate aldolase